MFKNLRHAARTLLGQPGFVTVAVMSLAIGIGANTAMYSFADGYLLRPMAIRQPSRMVDVTPVPRSDLDSSSLSYPDYVNLRQHNHSFTGLVATAFAQFGIAPSRTTQPRVKLGLFVSGNFFRVLGVDPELGRGFLDSEDTAPGRDAVAVLSHDTWMSDFGGDPGVIGRHILLNGVAFTVVGVAPKSFAGLGMLKSAAYVPIAMSARLWTPDMLTDRANRWLAVRGRLKPAVSLSGAQADVAMLGDALRRAYPRADASLKLRVQTELQTRFAQSPPDTAMIAMLSALAACVLLIACGNVAGLLIGRGAARSREMAVRAALGAKRSVLVGQLLLESLLIALAGGAAGLVVAAAANRFLNHLPVPADSPIDFEARLDGRALLFMLTVSFASTLLFGLAPALRGTRLDLQSALKERSATASKSARLWGRSIMVSAQVALSLVLLIVCAVLVQGFHSELDRGPGFRVDRLQMMSFDTSLMHYTDAQREAFYKKLRDGVMTIPAVAKAALTSDVPLDNSNTAIPLLPQGFEVKRGDRPPTILRDVVTPGFFDVMQIPVVQGRPFNEADRADTRAVAIVNQQFAEHFWPHQDAVGKTLRLNTGDSREVSVIGVAKTTKYVWIAEQPMDFVYLPLSQNPNSGMTLVAESKGPDPLALVPELTALAQRLDPNMPIFGVHTVADLYHDRAVWVPQYIEKIVGAMGVMALLLSCVGLYGVVSYGVNRRTREFGVRLAVGARRVQVIGLVMREGLRLGIAGMAVGLACGIALAAMLRSQILFSFVPAGILPYASVCLLLLTTLCLAGYVPAYRASRTDPLRALREE